MHSCDLPLCLSQALPASCLAPPELAAQVSLGILRAPCEVDWGRGPTPSDRARPRLYPLNQCAQRMETQHCHFRRPQVSRIWGRRQEPPLPSCCPLRPKGKLETGGLWHAQRASSEAPLPLSGPFPWLFLQAGRRRAQHQPEPVAARLAVMFQPRRCLGPMVRALGKGGSGRKMPDSAS